MKPPDHGVPTDREGRVKILLEEFRVYRRTFHKQIEIAVHPLQFGQGYFRHDFKLTEFEAISNSGAIVAAVAAKATWNNQST